MMQNAFVEGMVQQNTTRPHFTYADRVIKYLIHPELIASEVSKFSITEQCLLVRDFMNRNQPEQYVRAEALPRDTPLAAVTFTQKIINKNISQQQQQQSQSDTNLNNLSTPISPPSSPLIYPSSNESFELNNDYEAISAASFTNKLPSSCDKYLSKRKKPVHYLHAAGKIVVLCDIKLEDLELYIPHLNLKKLIKYIITAGMNAPPTTQNSAKTKYILKSKLWKPTFQRWVINSLIDSGSSDILGHSAKHITNIQRGADTTINVLTYYMRLTTATKKKKRKKTEEKEEELTKPSWECMENGPKMFTLKGESSDEEGDNNINNPNEMSDDTEDKEEKKKRKIAKYYDKWSYIYGEDVSDLTAFMIQKRCVEKYEICCDIARYYFINENWIKAQKWLNRATRWYLRVDQKNLMSQKKLHFNQMISHKRYEWEQIYTLIKVLNAIILGNADARDVDYDTLTIYECCQWIVHKQHDKIEERLYRLLCDIWNDPQTRNGLSIALLKIWNHEMRSVYGESMQSVCYLRVFVIVYSLYRNCSDINIACDVNDERLMTRDNGKYAQFYMQLVNKMYVAANDDTMYQRIIGQIEFIANMNVNGFSQLIKNCEWIKEEDRNKCNAICTKNESKIDSIMDLDDDESQKEEKEDVMCWSQRIMSIKSSDAMKELLSQLIDKQDNDTYNMAIHYVINQCYTKHIDEWMDVLNHVMLSMISKYNRDQIAFIKLISEIENAQHLAPFMEQLSMKLNGIKVPSFTGLYALFTRCFAKTHNCAAQDKKLMMQLMEKVCNHLYSVIFEQRRDFEVKIKKMNDENEIYQHQYATIIYKHYLHQESLLNLFINQNKLVSNIQLFHYNSHTAHAFQADTKQHMQVLYRYVCDLCRNIKFLGKTEAGAKYDDIQKDYLYRVQTDTNIQLFCNDSTTQFLFHLFCNETIDDFMDIISPLIIGLIHGVYSKEKSNQNNNNKYKYLFLSFKENKYYEFILIAGMQLNTLIHKDFTQLIRKNMNKLLTFIYFVYHYIWNQSKDKKYFNISVLHKCSDILLAKSNECQALQLLMDNTNCMKKSERLLNNHSYISNEYGFIFCNDKIFSHFIYLCCLNGNKIEAVLLWQLSTDPNRIKYAINIIKKELTLKDAQHHIQKYPDMNIFECIWEPLILCQLKEKFSNGKSQIVNQKLDEYLASFEMGTDPKLKANKLCDFVFNNLLVRS